MKTLTLARFTELYLSYLNDFLTVEAFANYYGLTTADADFIVATGRAINNYQLECV